MLSIAPHIKWFPLACLLTVLALLGPVADSQGQSMLEQYQTEDLDSRNFSAAEWEQLQQELDYSGAPPEEKPKTERSPTTSRDRPSPRESRPARVGEGVSSAMKVILVIVLAGLIGWLAYHFLKQEEKNTKIATDPDSADINDITLDRIEEHLEKTDIDPYIAQAEAQGAYHKAVRLHYLALLKSLSTQGWVRWKKDYTNRNYLQQMSGRQEAPAFRSLTLDYERVWYGDHHPDQPQYYALKERFLQFRRAIDNQKTPDPA